MLWKNETPVYLYGAAGFGIKIYNNLHTSCNIVGFIDKRSDEVKNYLGLPVLDISYPSQHEKKSSTIIICVKNIFEHESIFLSLLKNGFDYIVFLPVDESMYVYRSKTEREKLIALYNSISDGYFSLPSEIPPAKGLFRLNFIDSAVINKVDGLFTVLVPSPFVFNRPKGEGYLSDIPVLSLFAHIDAFKYFSGNPGVDCKDYMEIITLVAGEAGQFERTQRWKENVLDGRRMIFERMDVAAQLSPSFFIDHAVKAVWNASGKYFNMLSGKHRASYLIYKRYLFIPLVMTVDDYNSYLNMDASYKLYEYLDKNNIIELPFPVLHPFFCKIPFALKGNFYNLVYDFVYWLSKEQYYENGILGINGLSVFDSTGQMYPFLQCLYKLGCKVGSTAHANEFEQLVNCLYHNPNHAITNELPLYCDVLIINYNQNQKSFSIPAKVRYYMVLLDKIDTINYINKRLSITLTQLGVYMNNYIFVAEKNKEI